LNIVEIIIRGVDQATKPLTAPIKSLKDLQGVASKLGPIVAATTAALGTAFVGLTRHAINLQDETGKLAQKAGTTSEEFSTLAHAADLSDVSNEQLSKGLRELGGQIDDVARGTATANNVLVRLGVSAKDAEGKARPVAEVLRDVAEAVKNLDANARTQAAKDLGRNFAEMVPMLAQGREGIEALQAEARQLGLEVSGSTSAAAQQFNDDLTRLTAVARGLTMQVAAALLPALSKLTTEFTNNALQSQGTARTANDLATGFRIVATAGLAVWHSLKFIANIIATAITVNFGVAVDLVRGLARSFGALVDGLQESGQKLLDFGKTLGGVGGIIGALLKGEFGEAKKAADAFFADFAEKGKTLFSANNTESIFTGISEGVKNAMRNAVAVPAEGFDRITTDALNYKRTFDAIWDTTTPTPQTLPEVVVSATPEFDEAALARFQEKREAALMKAQELERQLHEESLTGMARVRQQAENDFLARNEQIAKLLLTEEESIALTEKLQEAHQARLRQIEIDGAKARQAIMQQHLHNTSEIFGNMAAAAKAFGRKGFAAWKAFATAQAIIDTYGAANKAYHAMAGIPFVGPALGAAAAVAAIAAGMANVATIQSTQPAGAAHGGLDYVPAEATYLLDRGERVLSPRQNEDLTDALENGGVGGAQCIDIKVELDGRVLGEAIYDLTRTGRAQVHPRAVTDR
jgi:hypothetical protein